MEILDKPTFRCANLGVEYIGAESQIIDFLRCTLIAAKRRKRVDFAGSVRIIVANPSDCVVERNNFELTVPFL